MDDIRWGVYVRISQDRVGDAHGVANQEKQCREVAARRGGEVVQVFVENDTPSKRRKRRPVYDAMLAAARSKEITGIVGWDIDRLTRAGLLEIEELISLYEDFGTELAVVTGPVDLGTAGGRLMARQLASYARYEVEHKADRHRMQIEQKTQQGIPHGGGRRFGYEPTGLQLRETEAVILRECYQRALAGESLGGLARWLNAAGVTTPWGMRWRTIVVRRLLANPRNAGFMTVKGEITGPGQWPAVVDETTWRRVCALVERPVQAQPRGPRTYLLTGGLIVCGLCGEGLVGNAGSKRKTGPAPRRYVCRHDQMTDRGCGRLSCMAEWIEDAVGEQVLARVSSTKNRKALARQLSERDKTGTTLATGLAADEEQLRQLGADFADGLVPREAFLAATNKVQARIDDANARLASVMRSPLPSIDPDQAAAWWETATLGQRRALVAVMIDGPIKLAPSKVRGSPKAQPERLVLTWA